MLYVLTFYLLIFITNVSSKCQTLTKRKEIRQLSDTERKELVETIIALHNTKGPQGLSDFEEFGVVHEQSKQIAHGSPMFLPWHRKMLRMFEQKLQKINPKVSLAYWDWSVDYQDPAKSVVLSDGYFGGNGDLKNNNCVNNGPFKNFTFYTPKKSCLARKYDNEESLSVLYSPEIMLNLLQKKSFPDFHKQLEYMHGSVHVTVGSKPSNPETFVQLGSMYSPLDPLFYLHHTFIDMLWYSWQKMNSESVQYEANPSENKVQLTDEVKPFGVKVESTIFPTKNEDYCYDYEIYKAEKEKKLFEKVSKLNKETSGKKNNSKFPEASEGNLNKNSTKLPNEHKTDNNKNSTGLPNEHKAQNNTNSTKLPGKQEAEKHKEKVEGKHEFGKNNENPTSSDGYGVEKPKDSTKTPNEYGAEKSKDSTKAPNEYGAEKPKDSAKAPNEYGVEKPKDGAKAPNEYGAEKSKDSAKAPNEYGVEKPKDSANAPNEYGAEKSKDSAKAPNEYGVEKPKDSANAPNEYGAEKPKDSAKAPNEYGAEKPKDSAKAPNEYGVEKPKDSAKAPNEYGAEKSKDSAKAPNEYGAEKSKDSTKASNEYGAEKSKDDAKAPNEYGAEKSKDSAKAPNEYGVDKSKDSAKVPSEPKNNKSKELKPEVEKSDYKDKENKEINKDNKENSNNKIMQPLKIPIDFLKMNNIDIKEGEKIISNIKNFIKEFNEAEKDPIIPPKTFKQTYVDSGAFRESHYWISVFLVVMLIFY